MSGMCESDEARRIVHLTGFMHTTKERLNRSTDVEKIPKQNNYFLTTCNEPHAAGSGQYSHYNSTEADRIPSLRPCSRSKMCELLDATTTARLHQLIPGVIAANVSPQQPVPSTLAPSVPEFPSF
ncbi:unnamed protein product [Toxocara canis]|uniref:Uncharacterized protein n=1 Tax=Toxocara canis TaxID=6265 RepID=A0A183UEA1_TOXCA|nr:unnamed protein product [Toxocara canis]